LLVALAIVACGARTGLDLDTGSLENVGTTGAPDSGGGSGSSSGGVGPVLCGPTPRMLASGPDGSVSLVLDANNVYWTAQPYGNVADGGVLSVPLAGGTPTTLAYPQVTPLFVAVSATTVYWDNQEDGLIESVPIGGGTITTVVTGLGSNGPAGMTIDATSLYWADFGDECFPSGALIRAPLTGGMQTELATGQAEPWEIAVDAVALYWTNITEASDQGGSVVKVPIAGGSPVTLASGQHLPIAIALDDDSVYFTNNGTHAGNFLDGSVMKVAKRGGAAVTLASQQEGADGLAVDDTNVYWVRAASGMGDGAVLSVGKSGGPITTLASGQASPMAIAQSGDCVYWVNAGTNGNVDGPGTVMVVAK
jgi:sugar lactone lactonase YvrE